MSIITARIVASLVAGLLVSGLYILATTGIRRLTVSPEQRHRARNVSRYTLGVLLTAFLIIVWADELRSAALVASAFAVAIVLATKELLLCALGWWLKTAGDSYQLGDRIQIGEIKGDVLDYGLFTTTLMRVGTGEADELRSGAVVTVPNSMLLSNPVHALTHSLDYKWHEVTVTVPSDQSWRRHEQYLLMSGQEVLQERRAEIELQLQRMEENFAFRPIGSEPRVLVTMLDDERLRLCLRVALSVRRARLEEDRIVRRYLELRDEGAK